MKKLIFLIALFILSFIGCHQDQDQDQDHQYNIDIVGYWQLDNTKEFWRFDADGNVTRVAINGEWMDEDDDEFEGWTGTNKFNWSINEVGMLSIQIQLELLLPEYLLPEPDRFLIKNITSTKMTWVTIRGQWQATDFYS